MSITSAKSGATGISLALDNNYMEPIASTLLSGSSSVITFADIPQTYKHLQVRWFARGSSLAGLYWNFNGDLGTNYARHRLSADGATASAAGLASQTNIYSVASWGIPNTASTFAGGVYDILDYANTSKYKTMRGLAGQDSNGSGGVELVSGLWMDFNAINSIAITLNTGTFQANTRFSLYGIKG